jgi:RNase P protein component
MGYELRREIREALGPNVTGLQRAVALEIADDARHDADGRRSRASLKDLARWSGAKDTAVVRNALKRLAEAGWEFRVPIGKGKDGRILYATPGHSMEFRVPYPPEGAPAHSEGAPAHSDEENEEGARAHSEGAGAHSEGAPAHSEGAGATPPSQITTHIPTTPADAAGDESARGDAETQQRDDSTGVAAKKPAKKVSRKPAAKKAAEYPVADELTAAFWDRHGKGRAQSFVAVRSVIRTAVGNGVERNDLARALDRLVRDGMSVSGSTIDIALNKIRRPGGQAAPAPAPRNMTEEEKKRALKFG